MKSNPRRNTHSESFLDFVPYPGWVLIMICTGAMFLLQVITENFQKSYYFTLFRPWDAPGSLQGNYFWGIIGIVSYIFLHGDGAHLLWNMVFLYFFGKFTEGYLGRIAFLRLYFFSGIFAAVFWLIFSHWTQERAVIGASGALCGLFIATALFFPDVKVLLFFFIPLKLKWAALLSILITLLSLGDRTHTSHLTHLGGCLGGFFAAMFFHRHLIVWGKLRNFPWFRIRSSSRTFKQPSSSSSHSSSSNLESQVDHILDKIAKEGLKSLTEEEREILEKARKQLRGS